MSEITMQDLLKASKQIAENTAKEQDDIKVNDVNIEVSKKKTSIRKLSSKED